MKRLRPLTRSSGGSKDGKALHGVQRLPQHGGKADERYGKEDTRHGQYRS